MKRLIPLALLAASLAGPAYAAAPDPHAAEFKTFFASFQAAAKANDRQRLVDLVAYPVSDWSVERKHDVQSESIKDRADFLRRYDTLFTATMRAHAVTGKPQMLGDGRAMELWDDADAEFSFEFEWKDGAGWRVASFSIGPR